MSSGHRVVAAIDFGTHGTGFAWATRNAENEDLSSRRVNFFDQWENQGVGTRKNRSALLLDRDGSLLAWGHRAVHEKYAAAPERGLNLRTGFKMALQKNMAGAHGAGGPGGPGGLPGGPGGMVLAEDAEDPYRLVMLCLREVYRLALRQITRGVYVEDDIQWCLTVPAIWDGYTKDLMYRAAVEAGLPDDPQRLILVREPTAAALYCIAKGEGVLREPGTRFLVVDAGGGTVDITSYQVGADGKLAELGVPGGAKAGSEYINTEFMNLILVDRLGADFVSQVVSTNQNALTPVLDAWERAKWTFHPSADQPVIIPLSAPLYGALVQARAKAAKRRQKGRGPAEDGPAPFEVVVSPQEVTRLFDTVVDQTISHVDAQLREMRAASGVSGGEVAVLVGGFAESPFLHQRLGAHLAGRDVRMIVPEQPSIAVLAGAVHYAYDPTTFTSWRAPSTVGVGASMSFRDGIDRPELRVEDSAGRSLCSNRFDVFVRRRDSVRQRSTESRTYIPIDNNQRTVSMQICASPDREPVYVDEKEVKELARLDVDISDCLDLPLEQRRVEVEMTLTESRIEVTARNLRTGRPQSAAIEWTPTW